MELCSAEGLSEGGCAPDEGQSMNCQAATLCCPVAEQTSALAACLGTCQACAFNSVNSQT